MVSEETVRTLLAISTAIYTAPIAAIFLTPVTNLLRILMYLPFKQEKLLEEAKRQGHIIEATLEKRRYRFNQRIGNREYDYNEGTYIYDCEGKQKKYKLCMESDLPQKITLYYVKKPRKATLPGNLGANEAPWIRLYLLTVLVWIVVIFIVCMIKFPADAAGWDTFLKQ